MNERETVGMIKDYTPPDETTDKAGCCVTLPGKASVARCGTITSSGPGMPDMARRYWVCIPGWTQALGECGVMVVVMVLKAVTQPSLSSPSPSSPSLPLNTEMRVFWDDRMQVLHCQKVVPVSEKESM